MEPQLPKAKKNMKGRPRGGATMPCPVCGANSHVIITRRTDDDVVIRKRRCLGDEGHPFDTVENVS